MRTVADLYEESLKVDIDYLVGQAFEASGEAYIREQQEQIFAGERADGEPIFNVNTGSEYYSASYARYKGKEAPIDLKDKGGFFGGMFTRLESEGLLIDSDDYKAGNLEKTYQPWLLNEHSMGNFIPIAGGHTIDFVIKTLNGQSV